MVRPDLAELAKARQFLAQSDAGSREWQARLAYEVLTVAGVQYSPVFGFGSTELSREAAVQASVSLW